MADAAITSPTSSSSAGPAVERKPFELSAFVLEKVLSNFTQRKMICCLGRFTDRGSESDRAIIIFEKAAFAENQLSPPATTAAATNAKVGAGDDEKAAGEDINKTTSTKSYFFSSASRLREMFVNDIYGNFECFPSPELNCNCCLPAPTHLIPVEDALVCVCVCTRSAFDYELIDFFVFCVVLFLRLCCMRFSGENDNHLSGDATTHRQIFHTGGVHFRGVVRRLRQQNVAAY